MLPDRDIPMTRRSNRRAASPAGAGALLIGAILTCAAVGLGIGALVGAPALVGAGRAGSSASGGVLDCL